MGSIYGYTFAILSVKSYNMLQRYEEKYRWTGLNFKDITTYNET